MKLCSSYEVQGLLNAGLDKKEQPIYVLLYNQIIQNKNEELIVNKLQSYFQQFRPFKGFVLIICAQDDLEINSKKVKKLIKQTIKDIIDKLIVISSNQNYGKKEKTIPFTLKLVLKDKIHLINNASYLNLYDIELNQSILRFMCNQIEFQEQQAFYGRDLDSYPVAQSGLPVFLEEILKFYTDNTVHLQKQGIFRLSGSYDEEIKLVDQLLQSNYEAIKVSDPNVIATVLKNSLVNLKTPIFPFEIYAILRETDPQAPINQLIDMFSIFFAHLPKVNRLIVFRLTEFIKFVAQFENENKMGLHNLSIIFAPCFFRTKSANELDIQGAKTIVLHFKSLIQNIDEFLEQQKKLSQ
ncbi:unnamed protein product (macronuclear) [Paramecium tetraurelia]|uniref:Rho-GAP domain-containing protein n=1 Tax=Paramecium tetraurelia TaxID=5888 RepID=A0EFG0_PARTE|nr:uncharacterized protein GSPATT00026374001 [Paramecium tetraurelia]CAK94051.1 unnamed protein product [Paramecium tetraurelia]|eukprot:XP_001461424.1 hypothetical protein (macronuclear) [Paramecium tetraurelia strain d4-2]